MGYLDQALGIAGALGRAYTGYSTGQVQKPPNGGGPLMKYLHGRQYGKQPNGTSQADGGLPDGAMPPPGPTAPVGAPPSMPMPPQPQSQPVPMSPPAIPTPSISPQAQPTPPTNPYQNPYPLQPPPTDQEDPNAVVPGSTQGQRFAQGTVVSSPTNAIIGEDGPEMVVPLSGRADAKVSPRNLPPQMQYGRR